MPELTQSSEQLVAGGAERNKRSAPSDRPFDYLMRGVGVIAAASITLFGWSVLQNAWPALSQFGSSMFTGTTWDISGNTFGVVPLLLDTLITTGIALLLAIPVGVFTALALVHLIPHPLRRLASTLVELLAAVPSVVYGLWGIWVLIPIFQSSIEPWLAKITNNQWIFSGSFQGFGILCAGTVLAIMILPTIVAISRDVIASVQQDLIEGGLSLGATKSQVLTRIVVPTAKTGILGAITLGAGRALGETIAVAMVIGANPKMPSSLFSTGSTLASNIATQFTEASGISANALGVLALILMVVTALINAGSRRLTRGSRAS